MIDFKKVKTYPIAQRKNLVSIRDFACLEDDVEVLENRNLGILAERIVEAFSNDNQIIWFKEGSALNAMAKEKLKSGKQ